MSDKPHNILILRGLDALTDEEKVSHLFTILSMILIIYKKKSLSQQIYQHLYDFNSTPKQVRLIRDRITGASFGFAFIEYHDSQTAAYYLPYLQRSGMAIDGRPVQFDFAKPGSFIEESSSYWDLNARITVYPRAGQQPSQLMDCYAGYDYRQSYNAAAEKSDQKQLPTSRDVVENDLADLYADLDAVVGTTTSSITTTTTISAAPAAGNVDNSENTVKDSDTSPQPPRIPTDKEWTDWQRLACLLCERQFSTADDLRRHQSVSELHLTNRERHTAQLYEEYYAQLGSRKDSGCDDDDAEAEAELDAGESGQSDGEEDCNDKRAPRRPKRLSKRKKRELMYSQSLLEQGYLPAEEARRLLVEKQQQQQESVATPQQSSSELTQGVGGRLLAKMGWQEGEGLGRDKSGIRLPVTADSAYSSSQSHGLGLGAAAYAISASQPAAGSMRSADGKVKHSRNSAADRDVKYQEQGRLTTMDRYYGRQ